MAGGEADTFNFTASNPQVREYLGGAGDDAFVMSGNVLVPGKINGQGGTDLLDYSAFGSGMEVNLASGTATGIFSGLTGALSGIENVMGSLFNDMLIGDILANWFNGNAGDDLLIGAGGDDILLGGSGNDIFRFFNDWGNDLISDLSGLDQLDFSNVSVALMFLMALAGMTVNGGAAVVTLNGSNVETLIGAVLMMINSFLTMAHP